MLVQLSPWNSTSINDSTSSKARSVTMVASATLFPPKNKPKTKHYSQKRQRLTSSKSNVGIVLTSPHSISLLQDRIIRSNEQQHTSSNEIDKTLSSLNKEFTISSRPGTTNAFIASASSATKSESPVQIPGLYDPNYNRLFTVTNKNKLIQIYDCKTAETSVEEPIYKTIDFSEERSKSDKAVLQSLSLYNKNNHEHKIMEESDGSIIVGCTQNGEILIVSRGGESYHMIQCHEKILEFDEKGEENNKSKPNLKHLWTGITHKYNDSKRSSWNYTISTLWLNTLKGTIYLRRTVIPNYSDDKNISIVSDSIKIKSFPSIVKTSLKEGSIDFDSIQVCSFSHNKFAFVYQTTSTSGDSKNWLCCYCKLSYDIDSSNLTLEINRPFVLLHDDSTPLYTCSLTSQIMAVYVVPSSKISSSSIILCDASRDGVIIKSTTSDELPFVTDKTPVLGMISNPTLNQLILFNKDSVSISSLQLSSQWDENENENKKENLRKKSRTTETKFNLASLLASSVSVHQDKYETSTSDSKYKLDDITLAKSGKETSDDRVKEKEDTIQENVSTYLTNMRNSEDPTSFLHVFHEALTTLLPSDDDDKDKKKYSSLKLPRSFPLSSNQSLPLAFIEKVCSLSLQIILSTENHVSDSEYDPILQVLLQLFSTHPQLVARYILNAVDSVKELPLVLLYRILMLASSDANEGGGIVTESFKVDVWRYIILKVNVEEVIHFYSFHLKYGDDNTDDDVMNIQDENVTVTQSLKIWIEKFKSKQMEALKQGEKSEGTQDYRKIVKSLMAKVAHDFSIKIILDSTSSNDALLRAALYHQEILNLDEIEVEIFVLASLLKAHGPDSLDNVEQVFNRQRIENIVQWINAVLDVHGGILIHNFRSTSHSFSMTYLHQIVHHELNISRDIVDLQPCLHLIRDSLESDDVGEHNEKKEFLNGPERNSIIPDYGIERLQF